MLCSFWDQVSCRRVYRLRCRVLYMTTYWHIAHPSYTSGSDLRCRVELEADGQAPEWMWDDAEEGLDGGVVCLFPDTPRGRTEAEWLWYERRPYVLLRVEVPADVEVGEVDEGYPCVEGRVPAAWITEVRRGYAERVVTRDGDEY
jgi:hypothetical protein